jgi:hypothetical protein
MWMLMESSIWRAALSAIRLRSRSGASLSNGRASGGRQVNNIYQHHVYETM